MPVINGEKYLTVNEIAARFEMSPRSVRTWIRSNNLPHMKLVGRVLVSEKDLNKFVAKALGTKN